MMDYQTGSMDWFAQHFLYAEKINGGDIRIVFLITDESYSTLRKMNRSFEVLAPKPEQLKVIKR